MDPFHSYAQEPSHFNQNDYHPYDENHLALTEDPFRPQMPQQGLPYQLPTPPYGPSTGGQQYPTPSGPPKGGQPYTAPYGPPKAGQLQPDFQHDEAPTSPPPSFVPQLEQASITAFDPAAMRRCLHRNTYVWLRNGRSFWLYPTFVGRNAVAGYRWSPSRRRWAYFGIDASEIRSFQCF